jgi:hypothetical protein
MISVRSLHFLSIQRCAGQFWRDATYVRTYNLSATSWQLCRSRNNRDAFEASYDADGVRVTAQAKLTATL